MKTILTSMKLSKKDRQGDGPMPARDAGPLYPWGLSLTLDDPALKKLKIEMPEVGDTLMLVARVEVTSVSLNDSADGGERRSVSLQVTEMSLGADKADASDFASKLYGKA